jgi:hypothetical protein
MVSVAAGLGNTLMMEPSTTEISRKTRFNDFYDAQRTPEIQNVVNRIDSMDNMGMFAGH